MSNFRTGADAAQEAAKFSGGNWQRTNWFSIEDGEAITLRFLTDHDQWITVDQHNNIKTKGAPADFKGDKWPERMYGVCRRDPAFSFGECYICDFLVDGKAVKKPSARQWALACIREEVLGDGSEEMGGPEKKGQRIGFKDATRTVTRRKEGSKDETEEVEEKAIVVVNQGWKNFFSTLQGYAGMNGTVLDRDYYIKRSGKGTDTTYAIMPFPPVEGFDVRNPDVRKRYESDLDLGAVVTDKASDEFYARFFDPRVTASSEGKVESTGQAAEVAKPSNDVDEEEKLAAMAARVTGYASGDSTPPAQPVAAGTSGGMRDFG